MVKFTEYDVLLKLNHSGKTDRESFIRLVRGDARFEKASEKSIYARIRSLKKEGYVTEKNGHLEVNAGNPRVWDLLAFIYWSTLKNRDFNVLLGEGPSSLFGAVLSGCKTLSDLMKQLKKSKPTTLGHIRTLVENGFIRKLKEKPLVLEANINDHTLYYINHLGLGFSEYREGHPLESIPEVHSKKLMQDLIRLHTYSTTVTEGNTASEEDVQKVLDNKPVKLTPKEMLEIVNTEKAVEKLIEYRGEEMTEERLLELHAILMNNLVDTPGKYHYGRKRIVGSAHKPPDSKEVVDSTVKAVINFAKKHADTKPLYIAPMAHLMFVSIHPFQDGNGRMARLIHSWILLKRNLPLFAYDPDMKIQYFNLLEEARNRDAWEFIRFCNTEHKKILEKHAQNN